MKTFTGSRCLAVLAVAIAAASITAGCGDPVPSATSTPPSEVVSPGTPAPQTTVPYSNVNGSIPPTSGTIDKPSTTVTTRPDPAEITLRGMTLPQKAAQVLLVAFDGTTLLPAVEEMLSRDPPAGLLLLGRNVEETGQLKELTAALQEAGTRNGQGIGLLIAVDQEGGPVQRIREGAPTVPAARALGDSVSLEEIARLAEETAGSLLELGVNMNLAPVADVVNDPESFLYQRTYGGDPQLVADCATEVIEAFRSSGLIAAVKHFPGHGSAAGDTHGGAVVSEATRAEFAATHLPPFRASLDAQVECVMVAHLVASAYDADRPASLSIKVIEELLRDELGFSGVVIADDLEMAAAVGAVTGNGTDQPAGSGAGGGGVAVSALEAGCDLLISTGTADRQQQMLHAIVEAVESGRLSPERLDEAVLRVLGLKSRYGLLPLQG